MFAIKTLDYLKLYTEGKLKAVTRDFVSVFSLRGTWLLCYINKLFKTLNMFVSHSSKTCKCLSQTV